MWKILTEDGKYCCYLNGFAQVRRNIIKARTSINGIKE